MPACCSHSFIHMAVPLQRQGEVRRSCQASLGAGSGEMGVPCWLCPDRVTRGSAAHPSWGGTGNEEPGVGSQPAPAAPLLQDAGGSPDVLLSQSPAETPQHLQLYCTICAWKGHISPQQQAVTVANVATCTPAAVVTGQFHRPRSLQREKNPKAQMKASVSNSCVPAGARRGPDVLETWCRAVLVSL